VHAVVQDQEDHQRIWVLTGDRDAESRILYSDDDFRTVDCFLDGGQMSRATDLIARDGMVYWGMDSPEETARLMVAEKDRPAMVRSQCELPGPAYYMGENRAGGMYVGTAVEPGVALRDDCAHIMGLGPDGAWEELAARRADRSPQHGIFYFPKGAMPENYVVFSQRALVPGEGSMTVARDRAWG
jgi:hypothetical protein